MPVLIIRPAPLQHIMLDDSMLEPTAGHHVEQVEVVFRAEHPAAALADAWQDVVAATDALRGEWANPGDWEWRPAAETPALEVRTEVRSFEKWRAADAARKLLVPGAVPWRVAYFPGKRRWVWTFHHALLDGRSIAAVLGSFLRRIAPGEAPPQRRLPQWPFLPPAVEAAAVESFRQEFRGLSSPPALAGAPGRAASAMGTAAAIALQRRAAAAGVTPSTILTWLWAQAVMDVSGGPAAIVEQTRCGAPQPGTAGFLLNTLPLRVERDDGSGPARQWQVLREKLLRLREFESFPPWALPEEVAALTCGEWASVLMTEHATLQHSADPDGRTLSIGLHEPPGSSLGAAAWLLPELLLKVEGPACAPLLHRWRERIAQVAAR